MQAPQKPEGNLFCSALSERYFKIVSSKKDFLNATSSEQVDLCFSI